MYRLIQCIQFTNDMYFDFVLFSSHFASHISFTDTDVSFGNKCTFGKTLLWAKLNCCGNDILENGYKPFSFVDLSVIINLYNVLFLIIYY